MKNISKAICAVMADVKNVEKGATVGNGRNAYKGVSDKDVKALLLPLMAKNGLSILPIKIDETCEFQEYTDNYGNAKTRFCVHVKGTYMLLHTSGESIEVQGYGHGIDAADKAPGKAMTYALKYALLYTFMVPVGDIEDTDTTHSQAHVAAAKPKEAPKPPAVKDADLDKLIAHALKNSINLDGIKKIRTLTDAQTKTVNDALGGA